MGLFGSYCWGNSNLEEDRVEKQASSDAEEAAHDAGQQSSHREDVCRQRIQLALCRDHLHHSSSNTIRHWCLILFALCLYGTVLPLRYLAMRL